MNALELLATLREKRIALSVDDGALRVRGNPEAVNDAALMARLREHKQELIEWLKREPHRGSPDGLVVPPPNRIPSGCAAITPDMLPLVQLSPEQIAFIVSHVSGGAANIQDVYPLAPLQEGILFHHLVSKEGDPYLSRALLGFGSRALLDEYARALQAVVDRHDILRTAVLWEGLPEAVQVVWRRAPLVVEEVDLEGGGSVEQQLKRRFDPRHYRADLRRAPVMRLAVAHDRENARWLGLIVQHHLLGDNASSSLMLSEVHAHVRGEQAGLAPAFPFRDFVAQARFGVSQDEHRAFFGELLGDVTEGTWPYALNEARGEVAVVTEARRALSAGVAQRLRRRASALGVSAASLFHLAWASVVARVSVRRDVVFGTVVLGRFHGGEGAARTLGPFVNTVPVRVRIDARNVEVGARETHALLTRLLWHEHAPLTLAQRCSGVSPAAALFTSLLNYRHAAPARANDRLPGIEDLGGEGRTSYPLLMSVDDFGDGFGLIAQAQDPVDADAVIELMATALEQLANALEQAPERALNELDVLPARERERLLVEWNATQAEYPRESCLQEAFEARALEAPEAVALAFEGQTLTYGELNARANRLAHHLRRRGVKPDARVGLCVERSLEMVVGLLGILKAGGAYVPLDPSYPEARLAYMVSDSEPKLVLTHPSVREKVNAVLGQLEGAEVPAIVDLVEDGEQWSEASAENLRRTEVGLRAEHLAYVIYTSGSTGKPKGVMIEHGSIVNRIVWMQDAYQMESGDAVLQKTPFGFDVSVWEFFWPLSTGAKLVMARPEAHKDPSYLTRVMQEEQITTVHFVPSMLQAFLRDDGAARCTSVKRVICSGEELPGAVAQSALETLGGARLYNLYGPTEATVDVTAWECTPEALAAGVSIGRPIHNTTTYILDEHGRPVPVGVVGHLHLGGVQIARGYLNRAELTAERFVRDPFSAEPGARMYATGDLARYRADGNIDFLGRNDDQVKLRGFRIELGEIEARLRAHEGVKDAAVIVRENRVGDQRLLAYYTEASAANRVSVEALRAHLSAELPTYMVPAAYVVLDALPLTPNGKLDRKALPAPADVRSGLERSAQGPRSPREESLASIWSDLLGVEPIGIDDNFFAIGGHSLLVMKALSRIATEMQIEMPLTHLFHYPTIRSLVERISLEEG